MRRTGATATATDFFNWMAHELLAARAELERVRADLERYQKVQVSNELSKVYAEYSRRS